MTKKEYGYASASSDGSVYVSGPEEGMDPDAAEALAADLLEVAKEARARAYMNQLHKKEREEMEARHKQERKELDERFK